MKGQQKSLENGIIINIYLIDIGVFLLGCEMKKLSLKSFLSGLFITFIPCVCIAEIKTYEHLLCKPIPQQITIKYANGEKRVINDPSITNLWEVEQNQEEIIGRKEGKHIVRYIYLSCWAANTPLEKCSGSNLKSNFYYPNIFNYKGGYFGNADPITSTITSGYIYPADSKLEQSKLSPKYWRATGFFTMSFDGDGNPRAEKISGSSGIWFQCKLKITNYKVGYYEPNDADNEHNFLINKALPFYIKDLDQDTGSDTDTDTGSDSDSN
jgi:hypothetical protein